MTAAQKHSFPQSLCLRMGHVGGHDNLVKLLGGQKTQAHSRLLETNALRVGSLGDLAALVVADLRVERRHQHLQAEKKTEEQKMLVRMMHRHQKVASQARESKADTFARTGLSSEFPTCFQKQAIALHVRMLSPGCLSDAAGWLRGWARCRRRSGLQTMRCCPTATESTAAHCTQSSA